MCQLFAFSASKQHNINKKLKAFFAESTNHPHGWGLATYSEGKLSNFVKEPLEANKSTLCERTTNEQVQTHMAIAHIRKATRGAMSTVNTHPFIRDTGEKKWVFAHNGTLSDNKWELNKYKPAGDTDSEKILCTLLNNLPKDTNKSANIYASLEKTIENLTQFGKLNLCFTDGEKLFVYSNREKNLYSLKTEDGFLFSTIPIDNNPEWKPLPTNVLFVFQDGKGIHKNHIKHTFTIAKEEPTKRIRAFQTKPMRHYGSFNI